MQGNDEYNMDGIDGIDEDLWQHIEAQLRDAKKPILGNRKWTVLHRAAARGLAEVVGRLLTACPFLIDERCNQGTALQLAAANGHAAIVTQLLAVDPTLAEGRTHDGGTVLHCAVPHAAIVAQLLAVNPSLAEARTDDDKLALHFAARGGHTATVVQLLAANPASIGRERDFRETALHYAASGGQTAIVTQLLALNPDLANAMTKRGWTALHAAAQNGHAATMTQLLMATNPVLLHMRAYGLTALHYAADGGHATITAQLLAAKASTEVRSGDGRTALHAAVLGGHSEIVSQLLAANPALIDARTNDGSTVLHLAHHDRIIAQLLAARPALLDALINDADSETALLNAVKLGQEETAIRLMAMHPNLKSITTKAGTVFHFAAYFAREKVMSWLLAAVSEPDLERVLRQRSTDRCFDAEPDMTALQVAAIRGHRNIVAQLLAACPSLIDVLSYWRGFRESAMDILLDKPASVHTVNESGNTLLHSMMIPEFSRRGKALHHNKQLIERVWKMNPHALRAVNHVGDTPFDIAVRTDGDNAIEVLQWGLTFAEIAKVYSHYEKSIERFKPLMQLQCEELAVELLPGLVDIVFEYLGFCTVKQKPSLRGQS